MSMPATMFTHGDEVLSIIWLKQVLRKLVWPSIKNKVSINKLLSATFDAKSSNKL